MIAKESDYEVFSSGIDEETSETAVREAREFVEGIKKFLKQLLTD